LFSELFQPPFGGEIGSSDGLSSAPWIAAGRAERTMLAAAPPEGGNFNDVISKGFGFRPGASE